MHIDIPKAAETIIYILNKNGYEAYVVGGCVRDSILKRKPEDWDITTSAKPAEIKKLFNKTIDTGIQHGTVTIRMGGCSYETTTYRIDGIYEDKRHPKQVEFTSKLSEDLKRRDFTINAMAYSPETGLVDMYGGISDLDNGIIRCVGNADERFDEDALRTLRAVRFAGQLDFTIEEKTYGAIKNASEYIKDISVERIRTEITKLILSSGADRMFLLYETGLSKWFLPEWDILVTQNKAKKPIDLINYINKNFIDISDRDHRILCYAALLLDMDSPDLILQRLKFDNYSIDKITGVIRYHDVSCGGDRYRMKKLIGEAGMDVMELYFYIKEAIAGRDNDPENEAAKALYIDIINNKEPVFMKDLSLSGSDLIENGIPAGKAMGVILNKLLDEVRGAPEKNNKEYLLKKASEIYKNI